MYHFSSLFPMALLVLALDVSVAFSLSAAPVRASWLQSRPADFPRASPVCATQEYDLARPEFDLLELRSFRRETIIQYDLINRSEVLRIILFGASALVFLFWPAIAAELYPTEDIDLLTNYLLAGSGTAAFGVLALGSKRSRGQKLRRLEREFEMGSLAVWQPGNALGVNRRSSLQALRERRRVLALYGPPSVLCEALAAAAIYRRWWVQSGVVLVAVRTTGSTDALADWEAASAGAEAQGWLYRPTDEFAWAESFERLLQGKQRETGSAPGAWLALTLKGRSCGSGVGVPPFDELLGTQLLPLQPLTENMPVSNDSGGELETGVIAAQAKLYAAIAAVDDETVAKLCLELDDDEVTALAESGRLDTWNNVLRDGATRGMKVSGQDAFVGPDRQQAWSTCIEFPSGGVGSLLATQRWVNVAPPGEPTKWRLAQHRTIPYVEDMDAAAALRCDRRGCVALQRKGGIKGPAGMPGDGRA